MKHTQADDQLLEQTVLYTLGALSQHEARAFEEHLAAGCAVCANELRPLESVISALGFAAAEVEPSPSVRERLLTQVAQSATAATVKVESASFLTVRAGEGEWRSISQGVSVKTLFGDRTTGTVTSLFKFEPGAHAPRHLHAGNEQCLIVAGDFHQNDETFGPGDYTCALAGSTHEDAWSEKGALLLIVAHASYTMGADQPVH